MPARDVHSRPLPFAPEESHSEIGFYVANFITQAPYRKKKSGQLGLKASSIRNYHNFLQHFKAFETAFSPQ